MPISRRPRRTRGMLRARVAAAAPLVIAVVSLTSLTTLNPAQAHAATPGAAMSTAAGPRLVSTKDAGSSSGGQGSDDKSGDKSGSAKAGDDTAGSGKAGSDKSDADKAGSDKAGSDKAGSDKTGADTAGSGAAGSDRTGSDTADPVQPDGQAGAASPAASGAGGQAGAAGPVPAAQTPEPPAAPFAAVGDASATGAGHWQVKVEPGDQTVPAGEKVTFTAKYAEADPPQAHTPDVAPATPRVRWQVSRAAGGAWSDVDGGDGAQLNVTAGAEMDGSAFRAEVSDEQGQATATSDPVTLHVTPPNAAPPSTAPPITGVPAGACPAAGGEPAEPAEPAEPRTAKPAPCPDAGTSAASYGTVTDQTIDLGRQQTAVGHNFAPGSKVRVTIEPDGVDLGTTEAAGDGTVTTRFDTSRLLAGEHTVTWTPVP